MNQAMQSPVTKGEAIVVGLEQIREGLEMVNKASRDVDLIRTLVGSHRGAQQLRDIMNTGLLKTVVLEMVAARNPRLASDTVAKVVQDFLGVLFDLAKPYEQQSEGDQV